MYDKIVELILAQAKEVNENLQNKIPVDLGANARLFGGKGVLDSIGLVTLIVAVEQSLEDELGVSLILANEKAISQKNSPFATVDSLAGYIIKLTKEEENG